MLQGLEPFSFIGVLVLEQVANHSERTVAGAVLFTEATREDM